MPSGQELETKRLLRRWSFGLIYKGFMGSRECVIAIILWGLWIYAQVGSWVF